jgi:predicted porin
MQAGSPYSPQSILSSKSGFTITPNSPARASNSINWKSNNMGGLTVNALYGLGETNQIDDRREGDIAALGVDYANGPVGVGLIIHHKNNGATANQKEWALGGSYDFGAVKLMGSYQQKKVGSVNDKIYQIGGMIPVSAAGSVNVAIAKYDADAGSNFDASSLGVVYTHALSKRTIGYVGYSLVDNKSASAKSVLASGVLGKDSHNYLVGVLHSF